MHKMVRSRHLPPSPTRLLRLTWSVMASSFPTRDPRGGNPDNDPGGDPQRPAPGPTGPGRPGPGRMGKDGPFQPGAGRSGGKPGTVRCAVCGTESRHSAWSAARLANQGSRWSRQAAQSSVTSARRSPPMRWQAACTAAWAPRRRT